MAATYDVANFRSKRLRTGDRSKLVPTNERLEYLFKLHEEMMANEKYAISL